MGESTNPRKGKIIVFGILFWYPLAGVTWQFLHYLLGLRRLGYDVYYVEDSGRWVYDPQLNDMSPDALPNVKAVAPILDRFGFEGRWAFRGNYPGGQCYGMSAEQILQLYRDADAFLNVTGAQENRGNDIEWDGQTYRWSKHHEFLKFIDLPKRRPNVGFELAAGVDENVMSMLTGNGWRNVHPVTISGDLERYRRYIQRSRGEFT